jgi:hypothetical protein
MAIPGQLSISLSRIGSDRSTLGTETLTARNPKAPQRTFGACGRRSTSGASGATAAPWPASRCRTQASFTATRRNERAGARADQKSIGFCFYLLIRAAKRCQARTHPPLPLAQEGIGSCRCDCLRRPGGRLRGHRLSSKEHTMQVGGTASGSGLARGQFGPFDGRTWLNTATRARCRELLSTPPGPRRR